MQRKTWYSILGVDAKPLSFKLVMLNGEILPMWKPSGYCVLLLLPCSVVLKHTCPFAAWHYPQSRHQTILQSSPLASKVIIEKWRGGRFSWNRNWDSGWVWAAQRTPAFYCQTKASCALIVRLWSFSFQFYQFHFLTLFFVSTLL